MVTLGQMRQATSHAAVTAYLEEHVLQGSSWLLMDVRRRYIRLEPPVDYWAVYRVRLWPRGVDGEAGPARVRELRLVVRGVFQTEHWESYSQRLAARFPAGAGGDPLAGAGNPVLFPESQHAIWFYPVDPRLTGLAAAADESRVQRAFRARKRDLLTKEARITGVEATLVRYLPEISAIIRYDIETNPPSAARTFYGKIEPGSRGERSYSSMQRLSGLAASFAGKINLPRPVAHIPELSLVLQEAAPGKALSGDRTLPEFMTGSAVAAEALALIHDSGVVSEDEIDLEDELNRLDHVQEQFALVLPKAHFQLRELLIHIRQNLKGLPPEERLATHGDLKYDQFLFHEGSFSLIDFEYFAVAETSFDLGKYCAHLMPSAPEDWKQSYAAEEARKLFLNRYRELRPAATLQRFPIYEAVHLANRSMTLMWAQGHGWNKAAVSLLVLAMERLKTRLPAGVL